MGGGSLGEVSGQAAVAANLEELKHVLEGT
jgi:hypothetical protein